MRYLMGVLVLCGLYLTVLLSLLTKDALVVVLTAVCAGVVLGTGHERWKFNFWVTSMGLVGIYIISAIIALGYPALQRLPVWEATKSFRFILATVLFFVCAAASGLRPTWRDHDSR